MNHEKAGTAGWAGLAVGVYLFDKYSPESLTSAFARAREHEHPFVRAAAIGALAVTAAHLMGVIPRELDPFYSLTERNSDGQPEVEGQ